MTALEPSSAARDMAIVMPRSLNDRWVGSSTFGQTSQSVSRDTSLARTSGCRPHCRLMIGVLGPIGSRSRYSSMTPRPRALRWRSCVGPASTRITPTTSWTSGAPAAVSTIVCRSASGADACARARLASGIPRPGRPLASRSAETPPARRRPATPPPAHPADRAPADSPEYWVVALPIGSTFMSA